MSSTYAYIIVGGGTAGCVLASRLSHAGHRVALFEAGPENYSPEIMSPTGAPHLHYTDAEYNWKTVPQPGLDNREIDTFGGKLLGGSSAVNYGLWTRGDRKDWDAWAGEVGDQRWSWDGMLEYMKKTEMHHDRDASEEMHGFEGPISTFAGLRNYPLKTPTLDALKQSGLKLNPDGNSGDPLGISAFTDTWKGNARQPAGRAYDLSKVELFTNTPVSRIEIDPHSKTATGITLISGRTITCSKEVLLCAGAIKSPQLLMLSGVGPAEHLKSFDIDTIAHLPVGQNLHDHVSGSMFWKLKNPEQGLAVGSPAFNEPRYFTGLPFEWIATLSTPNDILTKAAAHDGKIIDELFGTEPRANIEVLTGYAPIASAGTPFRLPFDGTHISTPVILLLPTSRGSVTLRSTNILDDPIIDPQYLATETDRAVLREGMRAALRVMDTPAARGFIDAETPPEGFPRLMTSSSDDEIDQRVKYVAAGFFHDGGTVSMGSCLETNCRVKGIKGLRVVDASILPGPVAGHYMAGVYAIAERAAAMILEEME